MQEAGNASENGIDRADAAAGSGAPGAAGKPAANHIVVGVAGVRYAIPVRGVVELDRVPPLTPVPNTPDFVLGVVNVRGEVVSVLDLRRLLGAAPTVRPEAGRLIQVRAGGGVHGGLLADAILGMRPLRLDELRPDPSAGSRIAAVIDGLHEDRPEPLRVLNLEKLFGTPEVGELLERARAGAASAGNEPS